MLISVQDVKDFLGISTNSEDDKIMPCCQSAQSSADGYVGYQLEGSTFVEILDGDGTDIIQLRNTPVKSVTSLYDDIDRLYGADSLIDPADYVFNERTGIITLVGLLFAPYVSNVKVVYLAGYGVGYTPLPKDLKLALVYLASAMYLEGKAGSTVFETGEDTKQATTYRPAYLKKESFKTLDGYRNMTL